MKIQNEVYTDIENVQEKTARHDQVLYNWLFHFNPHTLVWAAVHRDHYNEYWSDFKHKAVLRSADINTLVEIIQKTGGDHEQIKKLVGE